MQTSISTTNVGNKFKSISEWIMNPFAYAWFTKQTINWQVGLWEVAVVGEA